MTTAKDERALRANQMHEQYAASIRAYEEEQKQKNLQRAGMSAEQRKRHEALDFARVNVELSGGQVSEEVIQQSLRWADGEISINEFLDALMPQ